MGATFQFLLNGDAADDQLLAVMGRFLRWKKTPTWPEQFS